MAPNPRVVSAFRAMKAIGINESKVKPVLKRLLKLYDKNWELIEEENYRVLADAIFEDEDTEVPEENQYANEGNFQEAEVLDEPERPLKRLRVGLRNQEEQVTFVNNSKPNASGLTLKVPKEEKEEVPGPGTNAFQQPPNARAPQAVPISPRVLAASKGKQPVNSDTISPQMRHSYKGKEPMLPEVSPKGKSPVFNQSSRAVQIRDSVADTALTIVPKRKAPDTRGLIIPKEEPFTDGLPLDETPQIEAPIAMIRPDSLPIKDSSVQNASVVNSVQKENPAANSVVGEEKVQNVPASPHVTKTNHELATFSEESPTSLDIATSSSGEVKISLSCNSMCGRPYFHMPSQDELLKLMEEKCLRSYKILDPNFTVMKLLKDLCDCFLELATYSSHESQEGLMNLTPTLDVLKKSAVRNALDVGGVRENNYFSSVTLNGSIHISKSQISRLLQPSNGPDTRPQNEGTEGEQETESRELVVVPQSRLSSKELRSIHNVNDIAKGEENVEIPWTNEVNDELPPSFNYMPKNLVFQNALVNFTLFKIKAENCCPTCIGDCLSSSTPCVCSGDVCHGFAYTLEGLIKEDFLDDCISMARDPQRQCLSYCNDCPLERWKSDDISESCKGHLRRKCITECWTKCGCHKQCGNRVVQQGIQCKLQVFFTPEGKRWGLRTLEKLPKGAFVCEYAGEIMTCKEWYKRKAQRKSSTITEKNMHPVLLDAYWCFKGNLKDEEALCLDATFYGNVARFINHRCLDANLIEIPVKMETPEHYYYHLAFFTTREVDALEELNWDYGIDFDGNDNPTEAFSCQCGSKYCRNMKRTNSY